MSHHRSHLHPGINLHAESQGVQQAVQVPLHTRQPRGICMAHPDCMPAATSLAKRMLRLMNAMTLLDLDGRQYASSKRCL